MSIPSYKIIDKVFDVPLENPNYPGFMLGSYQTLIVSSTAQHGLVYKPSIDQLGEVPLVRINSACFSGDIFGDRRCDCTEQLFAAMDMIANDPGLIIYHFHHEGRGLGFTAKLSTYKEMAERGISTFQAMSERVSVNDLRQYGSAIAILKDLGINRIRLITNNPEKKAVLESHGIEVVETVPIIIKRPEIKGYLATKQAEQGHAIPVDEQQPADQVGTAEVRKEGLIVLGAKGGLGQAFLETVTENKELDDTHVHLFDKVSNPSLLIKECNLESSDSISLAIKSIDFSQSEHWRVLVASGIYNGSDFNSSSWEEINTTLQVNLIGVSQFIVQATNKIKQAGKSARIAIVSSAAASVGSRDLGYGISKSGLTGLVRSVSKQLAKEGITAIGIAPGIFKSNMSDKSQSKERQQDAINENHLGRRLEISEIARSAFFAVYEAPDALTGTFISPNGGQVLGVDLNCD